MYTVYAQLKYILCAPTPLQRCETKEEAEELCRKLNEECHHYEHFVKEYKDEK